MAIPGTPDALVSALEETKARLTAAEAALQQATAERDAAIKTCEMAAMSGGFYARHAESAETRANRAKVAHDTATSELARLRAEGEAKDRALKAKAEEQVAYWRERQRAEKCLEDGVSEDGQTYTPIGDEAAWQAGYCNGRMSEADWWAKTFLYWPDEAARAATAETAKPAAEAAWPTGCIKPNACSRHRTCVYAMSAEKCRHFGQDLGPAIEAADAARAATAREGA